MSQQSFNEWIKKAEFVFWHALGNNNRTLILTGRSFPGPPSIVSRSGGVWANPGETGLLPELWSAETKAWLQRGPVIVAHCAFWWQFRLLLRHDSCPLCEEAGRGSLCSPFCAAEGERGRGGGVEVSGLVKGLMGGWSYSGRRGREDGSFEGGEIYRKKQKSVSASRKY